MFRLKKISLFQFKNYDQWSFEFNGRVTGICGKNGVGKTNLLDAIHYLCFTKSYFSRQDNQNVRSGKSGFRLEGYFETNNATNKAACILRETGKKEFLINDDAYEKFSQHIGRYPCVVIAPDDASLITGASEERRKFIDALLSQLDSEYLEQLIAYVKILAQRNSLLKSFAESSTKDFELLDVLDQQLLKPGNFIFDKRKEFLVAFLALAVRLYNEISGKSEDINLFYESELLNDPFDELLRMNREKDCFVMRTTSGVHKDELEMQLDKFNFKTIASQGQRKNLLFALKLAEMQMLEKEKGFAPLLLLDDVFEKLDEERIGNLLNKVCLQNQGQVFITDTEEGRLSSHLKQAGCDFEMILLRNA